VLPLAREMQLEELVDEHPGRVPYLTAAQILIDSHALIAVGSEIPHYTASKIFPYILATRPLVAVFHQKSSVVTILKETQAGEVVEFGDNGPGDSTVEDLAFGLLRVLSLPPGSCPNTRWEAFEPYTARSMSCRLASVFNRAVEKNQSDIALLESKVPAMR